MGSSRALLQAICEAASSQAADKPSPLAGIFEIILQYEGQAKPVPSYMIGELTLRVHSLLTSAEEQLQRLSDWDPNLCRDALEKLMLTRLYPCVFAAGDEDAEMDTMLHEKLTTLQPLLTPERLGVAIPFCHAPSSCWDPAGHMLRQLAHHRAPKDKVTLIVNCCRLIEHQLQDLIKASRPDSVRDGMRPELSDRPVGADEFFPVLVYVVLQANPPSLHSHIAFISRFRNPEAMRGVQGCYFTHLRAATHFLHHLAFNDDGSEIVSKEAWDRSNSFGVADDFDKERFQQSMGAKCEVHRLGLEMGVSVKSLRLLATDVGMQRQGYVNL